MNKIITEETSPQCIECKKIINGKPWITVSCNDECVYACRYLCTKYLSNYVGKGYFDRIINKGDFDFPIIYNPHKYKKPAIISDLKLDEINQEIQEEEERVRQVEEEYMQSSDDELYEEN